MAVRHTQYTKDGKLIANYESTTSAATSTNIKRRSIVNCLTGWSKSAGGFKWRYND